MDEDLSVNPAGCTRGLGRFGGVVGCVWGLGIATFTFLWRRQGPEEAVGHHIAHTGAKAGVQALVQEGQGLAHGRL
jgi:hypothetical protein